MAQFDKDQNILFNGLESLIVKIKEYQAILGPDRGMGDWRPELRAWITEASERVRHNFDTHSGGGIPFKDAMPKSVRQRTNLAMRGTSASMVDEGSFALAADRPRSSSRDIAVRPGYRGLRDAASNIGRNDMVASNYKMGKIQVVMGARDGPDGIPYAKSLLSAYKGREARNYLDIEGNNYISMAQVLKDLVLDGVTARLEGRKNFNSRE